jgi:hypothetical protein
MEVSTVTAPLLRASPLKMKVDNALLSKEDIRYISVGYHRRDYTALCDWATYMHLGRQAATILAPLTPSAFDARLRLVIAPLSWIAVKTVNNSSLTSGQMDMKGVPTRPQPHINLP